MRDRTYRLPRLYLRQLSFGLLALAIACIFVVYALGCGASQHVEGPSTSLTQTVREPLIDGLGLPVTDGSGHPMYRDVQIAATNTGARAQSHGTETELKLATDTPPLTVPSIIPGNSTLKIGSSSTSFKGTALSRIPVIPIIFGLCSAIALAGSVYLVRLGHLRDAVYAGGAALLCATIAVFPEYVAIAGLLALVLLVIWLLSRRRLFQSDESNRATSEALVNLAGGSGPARRLVERTATLPSDVRVFDNIVETDALNRRS